VAEIQQIFILQDKIVGYRLISRNMLGTDYLIQLKKYINYQQIKKAYGGYEKHAEKKGIAHGTAVKAGKNNTGQYQNSIYDTIYR